MGDVPNNGPRGLGAIVKCSFITKDPKTREDGFDYVAGKCIILIASGGPYVKENGLNISQEVYLWEGRESGLKKAPSLSGTRTIQETVINSLFLITMGTTIGCNVAP